jgi:2-iminobutanoate/2-iminopropanoate deaminase
MFVTGQLAQDMDGNVVAPNDAEAQTKYVLDRISNILSDAGMTLDHVVKVQIFVTNMDDSAKVSKVRDQAFLISKPASTMVEVSRLMKPEYCVEIEVIAAEVR